MDFTKIVRGPAKIEYKTQTVYSQGEITVSYSTESTDIQTDAWGVVDKRRMGMKVVVEFVPVGEIEALAVLFPYADSVFGSSIFGGATDLPLTITTANETLTIKNAAITQIPSLKLSTGKTAFGSVQFTGIVSRTATTQAKLSENDSYFTSAAGGSIGTAFDPSKIITNAYDSEFDGVAFETEDGVEISFDLSLDEVKVDSYGLIDMRLSSVVATASFTPLYYGGDAPEWLDQWNAILLGSGQATASLSVTSTVTGGLVFTMPNAILQDAQNRYGTTVNQGGKVTLVSGRAFTNGAPSSVFSVEAKPAETP